MKHKGFTGTSKGMTEVQCRILRNYLEPDMMLHHGDCVGADAQAHAIALSENLGIIIHPPTNERKRAFCQGATEVRPAKAYPDRNLDIAKEGVDGLIACPETLHERTRSGTWSTVRRARKLGRHITIILPNGAVQIEERTHEVCR